MTPRRPTASRRRPASSVLGRRVAGERRADRRDREPRAGDRRRRRARGPRPATRRPREDARRAALRGARGRSRRPRRRGPPARAGGSATAEVRLGERGEQEREQRSVAPADVVRRALGLAERSRRGTPPGPAPRAGARAPRAIDLAGGGVAQMTASSRSAARAARCSASFLLRPNAARNRRRPSADADLERLRVIGARGREHDVAGRGSGPSAPTARAGSSSRARRARTPRARSARGSGARRTPSPASSPQSRKIAATSASTAFESTDDAMWARVANILPTTRNSWSPSCCPISARLLPAHDLRPRLGQAALPRNRGARRRGSGSRSPRGSASPRNSRRSLLRPAASLVEACVSAESRRSRSSNRYPRRSSHRSSAAGSQAPRSPES